MRYECSIHGEWDTAHESGCPSCMRQARRELKQLRAERDTAMDTLRLIADRKRRTQEQRLASACITFLDSLNQPPNAELRGASRDSGEASP
jgi:hypothetical protein